jgi:putative DNA primase/helicase
MQAVKEAARQINTNKIPLEMKERKQWVLWKQDSERGKVPYSTNGMRASSTNPDTWNSFEEILQKYSNGEYDGIGYMFHNSDPYTGVDLDDCIKGRKMSEEAKSTIIALNSYAELSPSGTGAHVIVKGEVPGERNRKGKYEMYDSKRFFTVTGRHIKRTPLTIEERQQELNSLYERIFNDVQEAQDVHQEEQTSPPMEDEDIMNIMLRAGNAERFKALYAGDISDYGNDHSTADLALCNMLAFYTQDAEQINRMFSNSGLMRDKWNRKDYSQNTISKAIRETKSRYKVFENERPEDVFSKISIPQNHLFTPYEGHNFLAPGTYPLTELGNAERIVHLHKDKIKHSPERGWLIWSGKRWKEDTGNQIEVIAAKTLRGIYQEANRATDDKVKAAIFKWAKRCESRNIRLNAVADTRPHVSVSNELLDSNPYLLNVQNGIVDLQTGKLLEHDSAHLITKLAPVVYDQEAAAPRWERFLQEIFIKENGQPDYEVIHFMQKAVGYSLSGDISEEVIFFLTGSGGNGKSKFLEAIQSVLGDYAKQTNANTFIRKQNDTNINNDIARLDKARFVSAIESEQGQQLAESLVKQLTGGDKIAARFLRKEFFEFRPEFKIFFSTNHKPIIRGTDDGIWRRVRLIPFNARFTGSKRDTSLSDKLEKELPGILNWAVEGFRLWKKEGLKPPQTVTAASQSYRDEMDIIKPFLDSYCLIDENAKEVAVKIYRSYKAYCHENGEIELNNRAFYRILEARGFELKDGSGNKRFLHGLKLKDDILT